MITENTVTNSITITLPTDKVIAIIEMFLKDKNNPFKEFFKDKTSNPPKNPILDTPKFFDPLDTTITPIPKSSDPTFNVWVEHFGSKAISARMFLEKALKHTELFAIINAQANVHHINGISIKLTQFAKNHSWLSCFDGYYPYPSSKIRLFQAKIPETDIN